MQFSISYCTGNLSHTARVEIFWSLLIQIQQCKQDLFKKCFEGFHKIYRQVVPVSLSQTNMKHLWSWDISWILISRCGKQIYACFSGVRFYLSFATPCSLCYRTETWCICRIFDWCTIFCFYYWTLFEFAWTTFVQWASYFQLRLD